MTGVNHLPLGPEPGDPRGYDPMADRALLPWGTGRSIEDLATHAGLTRANKWAYDTALPQDWVDDVFRKTGFDPVGMGIVWAYGPSGSGWFHGAPFALTPEAAVLLAWVLKPSE